MEIGNGTLPVTLVYDAVSIGEELSAFRNVGKDLPFDAPLKSQRIWMCKSHIAQDLGDSAAGWSTALKAGMSRVRFLMVSLEFIIELVLPAAVWYE